MSYPSYEMKKQTNFYFGNACLKSDIKHRAKQAAVSREQLTRPIACQCNLIC